MPKLASGSHPKYRRKQVKDKVYAVVSFDGRDVYLGAFDTPESYIAYGQALKEREQGPRAEPGTGLTVRAVAERYRRHASAGASRSTAILLGTVMGSLRQQCGDLEAARFGPKAFKALRRAWVDSGNCRVTANLKAGVVVRAFAWAVEEELVPPGVWHGLKAVKRLEPGGAFDYPDVTSVPLATVEATLAELGEPYRSMVRLQLAAGMRPGEVCAMRASEVDRSGDVWVYRPARHKTQGKGKTRAVALGPKAQAVLGRFLDQAAGPNSYLFVSPAKTARGRHVAGLTYQRAILRAAARAGVPHWGPHRLRHNAATMIEAVYGIKAAGSVLGHASEQTTAIYVDGDPKERAALEEAKRIAREVG